MECGSGGAGNFAGRERAQTPIIGLVLLIGIVALASLGILLVAGESTADVQQQAENERVESTFLELGQELRTASTASDVTRSVALDVERNGGRVTRTDSGTVRVQVDGGETVERSLGSLEYTAGDGTRVVYQAGGVWRVVDDEVRTISEPTIHFSDGTLTFPVAVFGEDVETERVDTDPLSLSTEHSELLYSGVNRDNVTITIESEYYEWWGEYFGEIVAGSSNLTVTVDHDAQSANATFEEFGEGLEFGGDLDPEHAVETEGGLDTSSSGASGIVGDVVTSGDATVRQEVTGDVVAKGDVSFAQQGKVTGRVATDGDVTGQHHGLNDVIAGGDVDIGGDVTGTVYAYGDVTIRYGQVTGTIVANGTVDINSARCNGCTVEEHVSEEDIGEHPSTYTDEIQPREPIDDFYAAAIDAADDDLGTLTSASGPVEAGTYVVDEIDVDKSGADDTLVIDVADGDVDIFVRDTVEMDNGGSIRVLNSDSSGNAARIFVDDDVTINGGGGGDDICPGPDEATRCDTIDDDDRNPHGLQLYGTTDASFSFGGQLRFHGIVYAPTGGTGDANAEVSAGGNLKFLGSFVAGGIDGNGQVSFEHEPTMIYSPPSLEGGGEAAVTADSMKYVHVTAHEIAVNET